MIIDCPSCGAVLDSTQNIIISRCKSSRSIFSCPTCGWEDHGMPTSCHTILFNIIHDDIIDFMIKEGKPVNKISIDILYNTGLTRNKYYNRDAGTHTIPIFRSSMILDGMKHRSYITSVQDFDGNEWFILLSKGSNKDPICDFVRFTLSHNRMDDKDKAFHSHQYVVRMTKHEFDELEQELIKFVKSKCTNTDSPVFEFDII